MKILITGARGQVGQELTRLCAAHGHDCLAAGREELDIGRSHSVNRLVSDFQPDVIINAAAYTAVDRAESEPDAADRINHLGALNLAEAASDCGAVLLHISTDFVFDGTKEGPYKEQDPCAPLSVYGNTKYQGERAVQDVGGRYIILRTSWVFGGEVSFVETMRRLAADRDELNVVSDQRGGPTPASEIAAVLVDIATKVTKTGFSDWGIYHFSGAPAVSWYEFACEILSGHPSIQINPIPSSGYPTPATRPANSVLKCQRIKDIFGIEQPNWREFL